MKKTILLIAALLLSLVASAQFAFSVSPGIQLSGTHFGYKVKKFVPYIGLQMVTAKGELNEKGMENSSPNGEITSYDETYTAKLNLFLPTIGFKYFFKESNKLKAYGNINFSKLIVAGRIEDSTDPTNQDNEDFQDVIKNSKVAAFQFGFGTEYFFDNNFSLGGEFGLNMFRFKAMDSYEYILTDPNTSQNVVVTNTDSYRARVNPTYAKISLNFYFGK